MYLELFTATLIICYALYKLSVVNFDYWKKRNVPHIKPVPFIGNVMEVLTSKTTYFEYLEKLYNQFQTPYFGIYILNKPFLVIKDPSLIKQIFEKDFTHFYNRNILSDEKCDPLVSKMLPFAHYPECKEMRIQLHPFFSKNHMRIMSELIDEVVHDMLNYIDENAHKSSIEAKELCAKYTTDVMARCALGLKSNSLKGENEELRKISQLVFDINTENSIRQLLYLFAPSIAQFFKMSFFNSKVSTFFRNIIWTIIKERKKSNIKASDAIGIIIDAMKDDESYKSQFERDAIVAQVAIVFLAGLETSSTVMSFTLYELAVNPNIQAKLRHEIKSAVLQGGELSYDTLPDIKYLHMVILETLRKYPPVSYLDRACTTEYKLPNSDLTIEKSIPVIVSSFGLNHDPDYFPEPEKYNPDRFLDDNDNLLGSVFLPFGLGPRDCIGKRFALTLVKMGLVRILLKYELLMCPETPSSIIFAMKTVVPNVAKGLPIRFKKLM